MYTSSSPDDRLESLTIRFVDTSKIVLVLLLATALRNHSIGVIQYHDREVSVSMISIHFNSSKVNMEIPCLGQLFLRRSCQPLFIGPEYERSCELQP